MAEQETKSGNKNLIMIIAGVVVLILVGVAAFYFFGNSSDSGTTADTANTAGGGASSSDGAASSGGGAEVAVTDPETTVEVEALANINQRQGPGTDYGTVGSLPQGSKAVAVGRNQDGSWILVQTDSGNQVWMTAGSEFVKANGDIMSLAVVKAAAPPYDANSPIVKQVLNEIPLVVHHEKTFTCASHGGLNNLEPEVAEGNVLGPHSGDFVYNGNNVLFKMVNGSVVLINENPIARFEGSAETMPLSKGLQLFADGEIIWNGTLGATPARGVTGCDLQVPQ